MTKGTHLLRSALLALLGLVVISGGSLAAGDLFDKDYKDCPYQTRLRDGQIADLAVARDSDDADHVNVSWTATDASGWGLGPNTYNTSLVVLLDGDKLHKKTLSLGSRKHTFEEVVTGKSVKVQMAIVVDHADGDYLISDILEQSIDQSLSKPSFSTGWHQVSGATMPKRTGKVSDFKITSTAQAGMLYYIGYNENFGNYKSSDSDLITTPATARLRIGLAHSADETDGERDDVDFDAYIIRIVDGDGDVVNEGDDVATVKSSYGNDADEATAGTGANDHNFNHDGSDTTPVMKLPIPNKLFVYGLSTEPTFNAGPTPAKGTIGTAGYALSSVRVVDGDDITVAMHDSTAVGGRTSEQVNPTTISIVKVDGFDFDGQGNVVQGTTDSDGSYSLSQDASGRVFAEPPNEHRDLPIDTFTSDETYTISAWAINDDDEVISPVVKIQVRPRDTARAPLTNFRDYKVTEDTNLADLTTTEFTVLK